MLCSNNAADSSHAGQILHNKSLKTISAFILLKAFVI
jgi:hypothetical protein